MYIKNQITEDLVLTHYDQNKGLVLACDASPVSIGAVLQQRKDDGSLKPIGFISRSLSSAERGYAQIEREALSIIFGVQKFRQYLLGRHFTLLTDHQPLVILFGEHTGIPQLASARIKRWAMILSAYSYTVKYITSKDNACADYLSRAPLNHMNANQEEENVLEVESEYKDFPETPLTAKVVAAETVHDPILSKVLHLTQVGWPSKCPGPDFRPFYIRRTELSLEQGCVLWGNRVVIPKTLQSMLLLDLHTEHMGVVRMKAMARQYFWWPGMENEIEDITKKCLSCQENATAPPTAPVASWNWPSGPWKRIHIDYAGPFLGSMFIIVVDAYSKWLEVIKVSQPTTSTTILHLLRLFTTFGLPEHLVSDNGSQFTSAEFTEFLSQNNIRHTRSAPGHPASNGLAERYVGFFKAQMKKMENDKLTIERKIDRILFAYRTTPHPATGETPCFLLMKRELRTRFSDIRPSMERKMDTFDANTNCTAKYAVGSKVFVKNLRPSGPRWLPGIIVEVLQRSYSVEIGGALCKRHENQLRPRHGTLGEHQQCLSYQTLPNLPAASTTQETSETLPDEHHEETTAPPVQSSSVPEPASNPAPDPAPSPASCMPPRRNPPRSRQPPLRYSDEFNG